MDEGGSRNGAFISEEAQCGGPLGRAPLLGTLENMLRKATDMGISLLGNLEGIRLPELLREQDSISGFLSWTQRTLISVKGQNSTELILDYGAEKADL